MGSDEGLSIITEDDTEGKPKATPDERRSRRSVKLILRFFMRLISKRAWLASLLTAGKKHDYNFDEICFELDSTRVGKTADDPRQEFLESLEPMREDIKFFEKICNQHSISAEELLSVLNEFDS